MMQRVLFLFLMAFLLPAATLHAGKYNEVLKIGDPAPEWTDLPGVDGKKHSLSDLKDKEAVVVVFACCSCPAVEDYEGRILEFVKKYQGKVGLVAINVNTNAEDRMPQMKERAKDSGYTFPYLHDESQKIGKAYGAFYTPEFFLLDKSRKIVYMGAMDDKDNATQVKTRFLEDAVEAVLKGTPIAVTETLGRGCRVRYNRPKS